MRLNPPTQYADDRNLAARQQGAFTTYGDVAAFLCG